MKCETNILELISTSIDGQLSAMEEIALQRERQQHPEIEALYQKELRFKNKLKHNLESAASDADFKSNFWREFYARTTSSDK